MSQWQAIETAPKDRLILAVDHGIIRMVHWDSNQFAKNPRPFWTWWSNSKTCERNFQPTHWMPLPEPPEAMK
jgi:hypothetical protein